MTDDNKDVRLQILLSEGCRSDDDRAQVRKVLEQEGMPPSSEGLATISARVSAEAFGKLFPDAGAETAGVLPIPEPLKPFVRSISLAPGHLYFGKKENPT